MRSLGHNPSPSQDEVSDAGFKEISVDDRERCQVENMRHQLRGDNSVVRQVVDKRYTLIPSAASFRRWLFEIEYLYSISYSGAGHRHKRVYLIPESK